MILKENDHKKSRVKMAKRKSIGRKFAIDDELLSSPLPVSAAEQE